MNAPDGTPQKPIVAVGSALVDLLIHETDDFIKQIKTAKGGMTLVDNDFIVKMLEVTQKIPTVVPGGSAGNTIVGVGALGNSARFVGMRGNDAIGKQYEDALRDRNVVPHLGLSSTPTGRVVSVITPDAQRTMFTHLGASAEMTSTELIPDMFRDASYVHVEGYLLFNRELIVAAMERAKDAGAKVCLDLASFTVVEQAKELLEKLVDEYVDILLANEDEARAFTGIESELDALGKLAERVEIAALKVGSRGSYLMRDGAPIKVDPVSGGEVVDTTGAGDLWAAGLLYGLNNGLSLAQAGDLASACGAEVCRVVGAHIPDEGYERIRKLLTMD